MEVQLTRAEALEVRRKRIPGLTQHALAKAAGLHPVYGADVLRGSRGSEEALNKLEAALSAREHKRVA